MESSSQSLKQLVTGAALDFYPAKLCQLGMTVQNYFGYITKKQKNFLKGKT